MITQLYISGHLGRNEDLTLTADDAHWKTGLCTTHNVTGLTLYSDGDFLTILEGSSDATLSVLESFGQDPRITTVKVVLREEKRAREFGQYTIGFRGVDYSHQNAQTFRLTSDSLTQVLPDQPSSTVRILTNSFARVHNLRAG